MITLGLVDSVDATGVYLSMPGAKGVLRGPYRALRSVASGNTVLVASTDEGEQVVVGPVPGADGLVDVRSFGAVGDGTVDDTVAVRAAFAAATALRTVGLGGNIYRPGATVVLNGTFNLASLDAPIVASCNIDGRNGTLVAPQGYDDVVLLAGHATDGLSLHNAEMALPNVIKVGATSLASGSVGVRVQNLTHSNVSCGRITHFETGLHVTGLGAGSVYNTITIGWIDLCKVSIDLRPGAGGWSNQNTYVGGGITQSPNTLDGGSLDDRRRSGWRHVLADGSTGEGTVNANTFVGVSFEGDLSEFHLDFKYATHNTFTGCRHEQGSESVATSLSGDTFTTTGHGLAVDDPVVFLAEGSDALGLTAGAVYWVVAVPTSDTFKVAASRGGAAVTPATSGSDLVFYRPPAVRFDGTDGQCHDNTIGEFYSYPGPLDVRLTNAAFGNTVRQPHSAFAGYGKGDLMPGRNRIINGDFRVNQRGYVSASTVSAGTYTFDRWKATTSSSAFTFSASPSGQPVTIPSSKGMVQIVERANIEPGTYTLSWRGTAKGRVYNDGDSAPTVAASPITVDLDGSANVRVEIVAADGVAADVYEVQLERGEEATPFERVPISAALDACRRYFIRYGQEAAGVYREPIGTAAIFDSTTAWVPVTFPVPMRDTPTLTVSGTYLRLVADSAVAYWDTASIGVGTPRNARVAITSSGLTGGHAMLVDTGDYGGVVDFSAEL